MPFELKRDRLAGGEEPDEARAEMPFELKRGRLAGGEEPDEARAELAWSGPTRLG